MAYQTYTCRRFPSIGAFDYSADFDRAESSIVVRFLHDPAAPTLPVPFTVADCNHDRHRAEKLIADYFR